MKKLNKNNKSKKLKKKKITMNLHLKNNNLIQNYMKTHWKFPKVFFNIY